MSVTAPTKTQGGKELAEPFSLDIQLYQDDWTYMTVHTFGNAEPGKTYTWKHSNLTKDRNYHYRAHARVGTSGTGESVEADVYAGLDRPGQPIDFKAVSDGEIVHLSWKQPLKGERGGSYDPGSATYRLVRIYSDKTREEVAATISQTTYDDNPGFGEETTVSYELTAVNKAGEGLKEAKAGPLNVGKAAKLPFKESFKNGLMDHKGWKEESTQDDPYYTYRAWEYVKSSTMYYFPTDDNLVVEPQDNDEGLASCKYYAHSKDGQTESLISPRIDVSGKKAVSVDFYFWSLNASASKNTVKVAVNIDEKGWKEIFVTEPKESGEPGWEKISLPVELGNASTVRVRIDAVRHDGPITNVFIDNISVEEITSKGLQSTNQDVVDDGPEECFMLSGAKVSNISRPGIYIVKKGKKVYKKVVK